MKSKLLLTNRHQYNVSVVTIPMSGRFCVPEGVHRKPPTGLRFIQSG